VHFFGRFEHQALVAHPLYEGHSCGYAEARLVDERSGSVHTGLSICELANDGTLSPHVHSYEESFYVLSGRAILDIEDRIYALAPGDFGALKVGTSHAWRNAGGEPVRWLQMAAPQPKPAARERDTFFVRDATRAAGTTPLSSAPAHGDLLGHFDLDQIPQGPERRLRAVDRRRLRARLRERELRTGALAGDVLAAAAGGERVSIRRGLGETSQRARRTLT
jgi:mannose-6-phosphate isomerase-like protein (cupin superfamily)